MVERRFFSRSAQQLDEEERSYACLCCRDTGYVIETWKLRDESVVTNEEIAQLAEQWGCGHMEVMNRTCKSTQPPIACKCDALYKSYIKCTTKGEDGKIRYVTSDEVKERMKMTTLGFATAQECSRLHREALEQMRSSANRQRNVVQALQALDEGMAF